MQAYRFIHRVIEDLILKVLFNLVIHSKIMHWELLLFVLGQLRIQYDDLIPGVSWVKLCVDDIIGRQLKSDPKLIHERGFCVELCWLTELVSNVRFQLMTNLLLLWKYRKIMVAQWDAFFRKPLISLIYNLKTMILPKILTLSNPLRLLYIQDFCHNLVRPLII